MDKILHPVTGQDGYFCSKREKEMIDVALIFMSENQSMDSSRSSECGGLDG